MQLTRVPLFLLFGLLRESKKQQGKRVLLGGGDSIYFGLKAPTWGLP